MDDDTTELATELCTRIGMIMEDASVTALTVGLVNGNEREVAISQLDIAARRISTLVAAVLAIGE